MEIFGIYFDVVQASQAPKGPFGLSILAWGVILFTVASVSIIAQLWWHIYKGEHRVSSVIKGLKAFRVVVGEGQSDAATVLFQMQTKLAMTISEYDIRGAIIEQFGEKARYSEADQVINATNALIGELSLLKIIHSESRLQSSGPHPYDLLYWSLTDFGKEVIQRLQKPPVSRKGGSQT